MSGVGSVMKGVWLVWCGLLLVEALPWHKLGIRDRQVCGDRLADIMSLVCSGRGYNVAFRPERGNGRRFRRGIVDECCYKSCPRAMLEQYCQTDSTEELSNVPIRKRSQSTESSELHQTGDISQLSTTEAGTIKTYTPGKLPETLPTGLKKESDASYKLLNLLAPPQKHNTRSLSNKVTPNDTTEEDFYSLSKNPPMRHKNHHHSLRQLRGRKASTKTKRAKDASEEGSQTFQIGMVKPYFAGRALASYHSNYVHHPTLS